MASQKQLEGTRVTRKGDSNTKVWHPHLQGWLQEDQANHYTQIKHDLQILQIRQKQGGVLT